jgi:hypothetical protein
MVSTLEPSFYEIPFTRACGRVKKALGGAAFPPCGHGTVLGNGATIKAFVGDPEALPLSLVCTKVS